MLRPLTAACLVGGGAPVIIRVLSNADGVAKGQTHGLDCCAVSFWCSMSRYASQFRFPGNSTRTQRPRATACGLPSSGAGAFTPISRYHYLLLVVQSLPAFSG
ncbi:hypothetical protein BX600DRAFT_452941 [Xylariales sp. PMI_506]|nr:hypothetical protein BX600DRAFT_452941 [Xylariales sp. PMI_506]